MGNQKRAEEAQWRATRGMQNVDQMSLSKSAHNEKTGVAPNLYLTPILCKFNFWCHGQCDPVRAGIGNLAGECFSVCRFVPNGIVGSNSARRGRFGAIPGLGSDRIDDLQTRLGYFLCLLSRRRSGARPVEKMLRGRGSMALMARLIPSVS
jgi:hypothetical protein